MSDRNLASLPEVGFLLGKHPDTIRRKLGAGNRKLVAALISTDGERPEFSVPILCRQYHRETYEFILPQFYERLTEYRTRSKAS
jgi:hypothetical protein